MARTVFFDGDDWGPLLWKIDFLTLTSILKLFLVFALKKKKYIFSIKIFQIMYESNLIDNFPYRIKEIKIKVAKNP